MPSSRHEALLRTCLTCLEAIPDTAAACSCFPSDEELLPVSMIKTIGDGKGQNICRQCGEHRSRTDLEYRRTDASGLIPVAVCKKHEHEKNDAKELVVCISSQLAGSESYRQACTAANFFNELYTPAKVVVTVEKVKDPPVVLPDTPATGFVMVFPKSGDRTPDSVLWYAHDKRYSRSTLAAEDLARVLTGLPRLHYTAPSTSTFMDRTKNFAGNVSSYGQNLTDNEKTTTYFKKVVETCPHCKSSSMPECGMCGSCEALFVSVVKEPYLTISCTKDNIGSECTAILLAGLVIGAHKKDDMTCTIKRTRVSMYACSECFHFQNGTNYKCETCTTLLAPSVASVEKTWKKKNYVAVHMDMSHLGHPPKGILLPNAVTTDNLEKMTSEVHSINSLWKRCNNISTKGHAPYCNERCLGSCGGLVVSQQGPVTPNRVYPAVPEPLLRVDPVVKPEPSTPEPEPKPANLKN
eukprot:TRINITY_DN1549_c3_g2_i4.p1 TRINITY_DN1549_c3_g2~~TRINITY_DN1549_c3_g2_i4.p1  ORF type:complete len:466 (+),score=100.24 TRINITY_DN1549_c3_g2_i4:37-1434(+)